MNEGDIMLTDIEIAQAASLRPIAEVAMTVGVPEAASAVERPSEGSPRWLPSNRYDLARMIW